MKKKIIFAIALFFGSLFYLGFHSLLFKSSNQEFSFIKNPCELNFEAFQVQCLDDGYVLWENSIPYPGKFKETSNPKILLDGKWKILLDSDNPNAIHIPSFENAETVQIPSTLNRVNGPHEGYEGLTWYQREFSLSEKDIEGAWTRLNLNGVLLRHRLWVNDQFVGSKEGGFTPTYYDVKKYLREGLNTITLQTDNRLTSVSLPPQIRDGHNSVWRNYGGIFRSVSLEKMPENNLFKIAGETKKQGDDYVYEGHIYFHQTNPHASINPSVSLTGADGKVVYRQGIADSKGNGNIRTFDFKIPVLASQLWSNMNPQMHALKVEWGDNDYTSIDVGLRTLQLDQTKFLVNGEKTFLKGISKMEDNPEAGLTQTNERIHNDINMIQDMNANFIRLAHYPHSNRVLDVASKKGVMVSEEIPLFHAGIGWTQWLVDYTNLKDFPVATSGIRHLTRNDLYINTVQSLLEMVERDRNQASVVLWFLGNETHTIGAKAEEYYKSLKKIVKHFDPSRPVTLAEMTYYFGPMDKLRSTPKVLDVASFNIYYGWYYGSIENGIDHILKSYDQNPNKPFFLSEFGAGAVKGRFSADLAEMPKRGDRLMVDRDYSEDYQAQVLEQYVSFAMESDFIIGVSPWVFSDFYCTWFPDNPISNYNLKGVTTSERKPKMGYYTLQRLYSKGQGEIVQIDWNGDKEKIN